VGGNKVLKELDLIGSYGNSNVGGAAGAKHVGAMLRVTTSITSIDLSANRLKPEGAKALAPAIRDSASLTSVRAK
jgi:hypothetical protein